MKSNRVMGKKRVFIVCYVLLIILLAVAVYYLSTRINDELYDSSYINLEEQLELQKELIVNEINSELESLELLGMSIQDTSDLQTDFASIVAQSGYDSNDGTLFYLNELGLGYTEAGAIIDISMETYFPLVQQGMNMVSQVIFNELGNSFSLIVPIMKDGVATGYLYKDLPALYLENLLTSAFDGASYSYIVDDLGNVIALDLNSYVLLPGEPLRTVLQRAEYQQDSELISDFDALLASFAATEKGFFNISYYEHVRLAYYTPLGINSWYLVSFFPEDALNDTVFTVQLSLYLLSGLMLLVILLFVLYISSLIRSNTKVRNSLIHELTSRIDVDPLTKLYIRKETEKRIDTYLSYTHEMQSSALFLVDLDDFKIVNTMFGEEYGDVVLKDAAQKIKKCFRESDIVGRVDRNLFIILLRNVSDPKIIRMKAEKILYELYSVTLGNSGSYITASIGIASCPENGKNLKEVYEKADAAMYHVKRMGKAGYAFYDDNLQHTIRKIQPPADEEVEERYVPNVDNLHSSLVSLMYGGKDTGNTVVEMLKKLAQSYQIDRCSVFEFNPKTQILSNAYEYHEEKYEPIHDTLKNVKAPSITALMADIEKNGIKEFTVFKELPEDVRNFFYKQKIASAICGYFEFDNTKGFILFAHCGIERKTWGASYYDIVSNSAKLYAMRRKKTSN